MDKCAIRIEINNLLDRECNRCPYGSVRSQTGNTTSKFIDECKTCLHYEKLRQLGDMLLNKEEKKMQMTVEEYHQLKAEHKTDTKVALVKNISQQTLYNWKKKHENELKSAKNDTKTAKNVTKSPESEKTANQEVQAKLSAKVKEQEKEISKLRVSLAERDRQVDALIEDKKRLLEKANDIKLQNELSKSASEWRHMKQQIADLNAAAADHEAQIISLRNDKTDLEHQLTYIARERDHFQSLSIRFESQLRALEAYVLTILEPAK